MTLNYASLCDGIGAVHVAYLALGNSMAVPVMAWIGRRIDLVDALLEAS